MEKQIANSSDILIAEMQKLTEAKSNEAKAFIEKVVPDQQRSAIECWGQQMMRLKAYNDESLRSCDHSVKRMVDLTLKLWKITSKQAESINRVYERTF